MSSFRVREQCFLSTRVTGTPEADESLDSGSVSELSKNATFMKFHAMVISKWIGKGARMLRVREDTAKVTAPGGIVGQTCPKIHQVLAMSPFRVWEQSFL